MPRTHDLKVHPDHFPALEDGRKRFELRLNDRDYRAGDVLILREWIGAYTGAVCVRAVTYMVTQDDGPWLADGYVALGLSEPWQPMSSYPKPPLWEDGPEVLLAVLNMGKPSVCIGQQRQRTDDPDEPEPGFRSGEWYLDVAPLAWMPLPKYLPSLDS